LLALLRGVASATLVALMLLCLAWELWLLALKVLPLVFPLRGILEGRRYTYQWASMLILGYFAEGVMRAWSERGTSQALAACEVALSLAFFAATIAFARATRRG
jgi:uncharacterized membrane protein